MHTSKADDVADSIRVVALCILSALTIGLLIYAYYGDAGSDAGSEDGIDAVILAREGTVTAQWHYQQLPMHECRWCGRRVNLNRHHVVPQAANPALRDVRENLIVLCRDCHFVLGHRCDWKRYNPDVMYIAEHFTNCVRSADTRAEVERPAAEPQPAEADWQSGVTNRESLDEAIGRLFDGTEGKRTD